jgi:hypothetical protein
MRSATGSECDQVHCTPLVNGVLCTYTGRDSLCPVLENLDFDRHITNMGTVAEAKGEPLKRLALSATALLSLGLGTGHTLAASSGPQRAHQASSTDATATPQDTAAPEATPTTTDVTGAVYYYPTPVGGETGPTTDGAAPPPQALAGASVSFGGNPVVERSVKVKLPHAVHLAKSGHSISKGHSAPPPTVPNTGAGGMSTRSAAVTHINLSGATRSDAPSAGVTVLPHTGGGSPVAPTIPLFFGMGAVALGALLRATRKPRTNR